MPEPTLVRVDLDTEPDHAALLAPEESERAARFRFETDRRRYVACRGALRRVLGERLGIAPEIVGIVYGPNGKPCLMSGELHFNVTHSAGLALIVLAETPIGVDLEAIRSDIEPLELGQSVFTEAELAALAPLSSEQQRTVFFTIWTRKEALVKCDGGGFSSPWLHKTVWPQPEPAVTERFLLSDEAISPGFSAAICVRVGTVE